MASWRPGVSHRKLEKCSIVIYKSSRMNLRPGPIPTPRKAPDGGRLNAALLLLLLTMALPRAVAEELVLSAATNNTPAFHKIEFRIDVPRTYSNPFNPEEVDVQIEVRQPDGSVLHLPAFWMQDYEHRPFPESGRLRDWFYPTGQPGWRARLSPTLPGRYEVLARLKDGRGRLASAPVPFDCLPSANPGYVRVSRKDPRFLAFSNGRPFFPVGQNLAFIGNQQYVNLSRASEIFAKLQENGGNYLRIWTCCEDWAMAIEARKSAWGRSWDWHPPIADAPAQPPGRQCLLVSPQRAALKADPSHPVGLRPDTRYQLTGKVYAAEDANLKVAIPRHGTAHAVTAVRGQWSEFKRTFTTGSSGHWLGAIEFSTDTAEPVYLQDLSLKEERGGPELLWEAEVNRPALGFYNPVDCFMLDQVVSAAERHGIYLQLCLLTRDLYMDRLKDTNSAAYGQAIADARKTLRYAIARWGYSTSVATWEYWNEMNPGLPTDRFYAELGDYLEQTDIYRHLRTTSTWGPSPKDCRHPQLDLADTHFYLRPTDAARLDDEVHAVLDRTRWLREHAPARPAHLGEFGLADDKWGLLPRMRQSSETSDIHNATWASALSGGSGTAMFWWWERLDERNVYPVYRAVSRFIEGIPWTSGEVTNVFSTSSDQRVRAIGLRAQNRAWVWFHNREAVWNKLEASSNPSAVMDAKVSLSAFPDGAYDVEWWDTTAGESNAEVTALAREGALQLQLPRFERDVACRVHATGGRAMK